MLEFLLKRGFKVVHTLPDYNNPTYNVWQFEYTDELQQAIEYYFNVYIPEHRKTV